MISMIIIKSLGTADTKYDLYYISQPYNRETGLVALFIVLLFLYCSSIIFLFYYLLWGKNILNAIYYIVNINGIIII